MGSIGRHRKTLLITAITASDPSAIKWAKEVTAEKWGSIAVESELFAFDQTKYYEASMGQHLQKQLFAYSELIDPATIVEAKHLSNQWEDEYLRGQDHSIERPINIDPGYLTEAKLVLATTKDRDHRIYLDRGIYAEVTLFFRKGVWECRPWTYADYQQQAYHDFFNRCRQYLRDRYKVLRASNDSQ